MVDRTTKLRWRRRVRKSRQHVESFGEQADQHLEEHVIGRLGRLWRVKRFIAIWVLLMTFLATLLVVQTRALSQYYQTEAPVPGGTYTEGIIGTFTNANPLYASGPVDSSVARLVFAGLFKYNSKNQLVGDLAESYQINDRGTVYTVTLKPDLKWQDGEPLTADDVVFTYQMIQNPDAKSVLFSSWQGVTVAATDARTITFTLPQSLNSFPYSMTNGIVPKHILSGIPPGQLRSVSFNTVNPVGAGPFKWETIEVAGESVTDREERIALKPNEHYQGGVPKLAGFIVRAFRTPEAVIASYNRNELNGAVGFNKVPDQISENKVRQYNFPLTSETMVFFKTSNPVLADAKVRRALAMATNNKEIAENLGYPVRLVDAPLLRGQLGYDPALVQPSYDPAAANTLLDEAGWIRGEDNIRYKDGLPLTFKTLSESTPEYAYVTSQLNKQWRAVGALPEFTLEPIEELQTALAFHNYDALLYGISIGVDPDVFAYWHSSQADIRSSNRLNFSEYKSATADQALEAGRSRSETELRAVKYQPFLEAWRTDMPAIGLYQPRFLYLTRQPVAGLEEHAINTATDRFNNVQNWMIRRQLVDLP